MNTRSGASSERTALKIFGVILFVVFGFLASTPYLAAHTQFYNGRGDFKWQIGSFRLVSLTHDINGLPIGNASAVCGILALVGLAMLVGVFTFAPIRKDRHVITHR